MGGQKGSVTCADLGGETVWIKRYGSERRAVRLAAMRGVAHRIGVPSLQPPPRHVTDAARATEQRRLLDLAGVGVRVPRVIGSGRGLLILDDVGPTLAACLRSARVAEAEELFSRAAHAVADVHQRGAYLGQPQARNITIDPVQGVGFIDFEEDPGEVMSVAHAQTRDWLVFAAGAAHHLPFCDAHMGQLLAPALDVASDDVKHGLGVSLERLNFLPSLTRRLGSRAAALGKAVRALGHGFGKRDALRSLLLGLLFFGLGFDYVQDGDLEAVELVERWLD